MERQESGKEGGGRSGKVEEGRTECEGRNMKTGGRLKEGGETKDVSCRMVEERGRTVEAGKMGGEK